MLSLGPRLKVVHLMALVAVVAVGLGLDSFPARRGRGRFPLRVALVGPPGRSIAGVAAGTVIDVERAVSYVNAPGRPPIQMNPMLWTAGQAFEVRVPCGSEISLLSGRELSPWQYRALVLRLGYADGSTQWVVRKIPGRWGSRDLTVIVP